MVRRRARPRASHRATLRRLTLSACAHGIVAAQSKTGVPMAFGVLTTNSAEEALERAVAGRGNKGWEAAEATLAMVRLLSALRAGPA